MDRKLRHEKIFKRLLPAVRPVIKLMFRYEYETLDRVSGPYLMLCNHNTDFDCAFAGLAAAKQLYFVATENVTRMGLLGKAAKSWFDPILHYKGTQGVATARRIMETVRKGSSVCMFAEGNRSFNGITCPIPPATGKLAKACGGALVTYRFRGGYFSWPRWGRGLRRGRVKGEIAGVYTREQLKEMTPEEVAAAIEKDLYVDAYQDQRSFPVKYRGRKIAEGLESTIFMCPVCKRIGSLHSRGDTLSCSCGFRAKYGSLGFLTDEKGSRHTVTELDRIQREELGRIFDDFGREDLFFSDSCLEEIISPDHTSRGKRKTVLRCFKDRFEIEDKTIFFSDVTGIAVNQRNLLMIHAGDIEGHWEFSGPRSFSALKYLYLFRLACGSENGIL